LSLSPVVSASATDFGGPKRPSSLPEPPWLGHNHRPSCLQEVSTTSTASVDKAVILKAFRLPLHPPTTPPRPPTFTTTSTPAVAPLLPSIPPQTARPLLLTIDPYHRAPLFLPLVQRVRMIRLLPFLPPVSMLPPTTHMLRVLKHTRHLTIPHTNRHNAPAASRPTQAAENHNTTPICTRVNSHLPHSLLHRLPQ
jgi:hypothetical protein